LFLLQTASDKNNNKLWEVSQFKLILFANSSSALDLLSPCSWFLLEWRANDLRAEYQFREIQNPKLWKEIKYKKTNKIHLL
jgi:hypothetical protein